MKRLLVVFAVLLNIMLLLSLTMTLIMSTPATAGTNKWTQIAIPDTNDLQLAPGTDVGAVAVSPDGDTLFAAVYAEPSCEVLTPGNWYVYKSVDSGYTWMASGYNGDGTPTEQIVAIDISPLWLDDDRVAVATIADVYRSNDRGNTFASMAATGLGNIMSLDVGLDENADAAYLIGTSQDAYISRNFGGWIRQNVADGNSSNVLAAAFSPNYITDGTVFAILQQYGSTPTTTLRCETDIETNNWGSYIKDAPFSSGDAGSAINATGSSIAFADDFSSVPSVFVGLVAYNESAQDGDAYRVDLGTVASTITDLDIRGEDTQTNVNSIAVSGDASSALILTGMHDLTSSGPMSTWVGQVHYSANGGDTWLRSYKPPSGLSATVCAPAMVMSPDFGESGVAYCGNGFINSSSATEMSGLYVSTTQGTSWNGRGLLDFDIDEIEDIIPSPDYDSDNTIFMVTRDAFVPDATYPLTNFGLLWESNDGGSRWELILSMTTLMPDYSGVAINKVEVPSTYPYEPSIFVTGGRNCMDSDDTARIDRSTDEGNLFATSFLAPYDAGTPQPVQAWAVIDKDTLIVSSTARIWKTTDTGAHWNETDASEIAPTETVTGMQLFNDSVVLVGTDCGNVYICPDWGTDFSFTQVGSVTLGSDNSVYVAFDADFNDNSYVYAGVTDTGDNDGQEGIWRVDASTNSSWDRLYDAGEDVYSIAHDGSGRLWALADGSAIESLNPSATNPGDVVFATVNTSLSSILTADLEAVGDRMFAIGGTNSTQLWTYTSVSDDPVITFPDPGLEDAIREAISKPSGNIYQSDIDEMNSLYADFKNISDLTGMEYCTSLDNLYLRYNHISNISALSGLTNLTRLELNDNQINNISVLSGLTGLAHLIIRQNQLSEIPALPGLIALIDLDLYYNQINNISGLSSLTSLTALDLRYNQISNLSALSGLDNLSSLYLSYNQITDISTLPGLVNLENIYLNNNQISDISALSTLTGLRCITIGDNQINNISALSALASLQWLWLDNNQISDISALSALTGLQELLLNDNQITDISALSGITNLTRLWLDNNQISDISALSDLTSLQELVLDDNQITDIQPLVDNPGLDAWGDYVYLNSNPLGVSAYTYGIPALQARHVYVEYTAPSEVWVDDDFFSLTPGWGINHFNKIQDGIDAVSGSTVHVAEGTYYENIVLKDGVELLGAGSDTTIIDGMQNGSVVTTDYVSNTTILDGFTVTNGSNGDGGGMYNYGGSPVITNCIFQNNTGTSNGGGMYNPYSASPTVTNCVFRNNSAHSGGGIYNTDSPTIIGCIFQNNSANSCGGGIYNTGSPTIIGCIFQNNSTGTYGGGIYNQYYTSPTITNCIFQDNSASDGGGVAYYYLLSGSPTIINCVFWNNYTWGGIGGGGILILNPGCQATIANCILWNNSVGSYASDTASQIYASDTNSITYCDIEGGREGTGNIDSDPLFVNASAGDFHLSASSPCIDAGSNSAPSFPTLDYENDPRILPVWGTADMGADEYIHPAPSCDSWDVQYRITGGQITMNYSAGGMTPVKKIVPLSEEQGGYMTFKFCREADNGSRLVVIPQDSWYMETILVENVMTGVHMNLSIGLDSDASGILYIEDSIGDVDVSSESVSGRTPVQIDTIGDGTMDAAGSMLIPMTLVGDFNTSVGQSGELPIGMIFTTENTSNVATIPENQKMDGATMTSEGAPFTEEGGVDPYVGTNGTISATGTGDCLGIRLVGIRIDFQFEMKLELEPVRTADVNCDGYINVLDMIRIGQHWGQTGSESWIPEDVNSDGTINVLDMIVIGQNWTG